MRFRWFLLCALPVLVPGRVFPADGWKTAYDSSGFLRTPRYDATVEYCKRLAGASPWARYAPFGRSPQGRDLPLLIVSRDRAFTPDAAAKTGKSIVLIQAGIHAGEIDGKDAGLGLLREMLIHKQSVELLDSVIILFVPIFNVDGHERFGPYNRINQNGPAEMGWRTTAQNLNLNRDYMKADTPEMRAMLALFTSWLPDLYVDCHVTDGIDFQYDVTYTTELGPNIPRALSGWMQDTLLSRVLPAVEESGHSIFWYIFPREELDLSKGMQSGAAPPRFSTGYAALQNRPSVLIETHMLKPYRVRVEATYHLLKAILTVLHSHGRGLRQLVRNADRALAGSAGGFFEPLRLGIGKGFHTRRFLGIRPQIEPSAVSGGTQIVYTGDPFELDVPFYDEIIVEDSVAVPHAYLVPPEWTFVPDILRAHGIRFERLSGARMMEVDSYRFSDVKCASRPYEGRQGVTYSTIPVHEQRLYPAGSLMIPMNQRAARVAVHLFEPHSGDSFVAWGMFNSIFEQKEYAEEYVMERLGKQMLEEDPALRKEFEDRVAADSAFAGNPGARLNWLYLRSPWADKKLNVYPVGRISGTMQ
jgi:hypothetical protein